jgi:Ca2+-transporting ATPase
MHIDWHSLDTATTQAELHTESHGLSAAEARARLVRRGPNELPEAPPPSNLAILLHQFTSPLIYILVAAMVVTLLIDELIDAGVIGAVLTLNATIGFVQERQAERAVRSLMHLVAPRARVLRDGREWEIESRELVPGDLVFLESGARVPADLRLATTNALTVDESMLTGESVPVTKHTGVLDATCVQADRTNMAFMGTVVSAGRARGYVVATGVHTVLGAIAEIVRTEKERDSPLEARLKRFARFVAVAVGTTSVLAFGGGVLMGERPVDMFMVAVALAVSAVPEGLPVVLTITLAIGVRRMANRRAIVRRLPAVETLGSTTVIGSDKTGTLTENRMTVLEVWADGQSFPIPGGGGRRVGKDDALPDITTLVEHRPLYLTLMAGVLTNEASLHGTGADQETRGDPTEAALLVAAARMGISPDTVRSRHGLVAEIPFEPERQYSAAYRHFESDAAVFVKGAPERVLTMCSHALTARGLVPLDHDRVHGAVREMGARGLRVLGLAYGTEAATERDALPPLERLVFLGLQGMMDPPRPGVREAILGCREAGIGVRMITGDHADTAMAIGREVGIASADASALTGSDIASLDDATLEERVEEVTVYARVAPDQKLRIVHALQRQGEVVAVTGDGVNDAPALKAADIGIAMGKSGTDVAREASDMVLADDDFVSIYAAVREGRITFANLRNVTFYLISGGAAEILMILAALAMGWPLPMVAAQILWLNLVTNGVQDVALAFEPGEGDVLKRAPRSREEGIISPLLWERTIVAGIVMAVGTLWLFQWELDQTESLSRARTVALTTMTVFQMFHVGNCRSEFTSAFRKSPLSNPFLFVATSAALLIHVGALYWAPTQYVLRVEPLGLREWQAIAIVGSSLIVAMELHKLVRRRAASHA